MFDSAKCPQCPHLYRVMKQRHALIIRKPNFFSKVFKISFSQNFLGTYFLGYILLHIRSVVKADCIYFKSARPSQAEIYWNVDNEMNTQMHSATRILDISSIHYFFAEGTKVKGR